MAIVDRRSRRYQCPKRPRLMPPPKKLPTKAANPPDVDLESGPEQTVGDGPTWPNRHPWVFALASSLILLVAYNGIFEPIRHLHEAKPIRTPVSLDGYRYTLESVTCKLSGHTETCTAVIDFRNDSHASGASSASFALYVGSDKFSGDALVSPPQLFPGQKATQALDFVLPINDSPTRFRIDGGLQSNTFDELNPFSRKHIDYDLG